MMLRWRFRRLRRAWADPGKAHTCALSVNVMYAEPFGQPRFGISATFIHAGGEGEIIGAGRTLRAALRATERELRKHNRRLVDVRRRTEDK